MPPQSKLRSPPSRSLSPKMHAVLKKANPAELPAELDIPIRLPSAMNPNTHPMMQKVDPSTLDNMQSPFPVRDRRPIASPNLALRASSVHSSETESVAYGELLGRVQATQDKESATAQDDRMAFEYDTVHRVPDVYSGVTQAALFDNQVVQNLLRRLNQLETENAQLKRDPIPKVKETEVRKQIFHTVGQDPGYDGSRESSSVTSDESSVADTQGGTFLSEPHWDVQDGKARLRGQFYVPDPDGYIERKGDVSFVVYKCYDIAYQQQEVDEAIKSNKAMPEPVPERQEFLLVSEEMIQAVTELFDQNSAFRDEFPLFNEREKMRPPFIWWYHYRKQFGISKLSPRQSELVSAFIDAIEESCGSLYNKIDDQFSKGLVSSLSMQYLTRIGSVLISNDGGIPQGHIALAHPVKKKNFSEEKKKHKQYYSARWNISTNTLIYKGELIWKDSEVSLDFTTESEHTEVAITSLPYVPLEYASSNVQQILRRRGAHPFWRRKHGQLVSYEESSTNKAIVRISPGTVIKPAILGLPWPFLMVTGPAIHD